MTDRFRDIIGQRRGEMRSVNALLAQKGVLTGLVASAGLAVSGLDPVKFKTTLQAVWEVLGVLYRKDATDSLTFSAAHTVTAQQYGVVLVQGSNAGTPVISTKVPASPQGYGSPALAAAALPAADSGKTAIGYFIILADRLTNGLQAIATLAISATATKFQTTTLAKVVIGGVSYDVPIQDLLTFSAAHVVSTTKFGVILVQSDANGVISTKVPGSPQTYADAPTALAALPAADTGNVALGYITIHAGGVDWTANTSALTTVGGFVDGTPSAEHNFVANTDSLAAVTLVAHDAAQSGAR
jgi:hypothetical protein